MIICTISEDNKAVYQSLYLYKYCSNLPVKASLITRSTLNSYEVHNAPAYKFNTSATSYRFGNPTFLSGTNLWQLVVI